MSTSPETAETRPERAPWWRGKRARVAISATALAALAITGINLVPTGNSSTPQGAITLASTSSAEPTPAPTEGPTDEPTDGGTTAPVIPAPVAPWEPTQVRVSTFNVLGYGHTMPGKRKGYSDGRTRQKRANEIIRSNNLEIVGFQEIETPQIEVFNAELGAKYDLWPGHAYTGKSGVNVRGNSIAWRKDQWRLLESSYYNAPYFKGVNVPRPVVLLENVRTGQKVYVTNTHNPANSFGNAAAARATNVKIQADLINRLRKADPTIPVIFTGDMNDRDKFLCPLMKSTSMRAANGGTMAGSKCVMPKAPFIDWVLGTPDIKWSNYQQVRTAYVKKTTDHPVIWADATIQSPTARKAGIKRAVVVDIQGLPSAALTGSQSTSTPNIDRLMATGASTLNARTAAEVAGSLPNLISTLSAKPVTAAGGAHKFVFSKDKPKKKSFATVAKKTGIYIPTLFDRVHDNGGSTSFMSSDKHSAIVMRSARKGARDTQGIDYGTKKVSVASIRKSDTSALKVLKDQIRLNPRTLSVVQFSGPRIAGEKYGYFSPKYKAAVRKVDSQIGSLWSSIRGNKNTASSTALIITSTNGGQQKSSKGSALTQSQIPLIVAAPGVKGGSNLYALNPTFKDPGSARPSYAGAQPLRNLNVGNLVTGVLGYPELWTASAATKAINIFPPAAPVQRR